MSNPIEMFLKRFNIKKETFSLYGVFGLTVFDISTGVPVKKLRIQKKNQITNQGRTAVLNLMCPYAYILLGGAQSELIISSLAVGVNPILPTAADDNTTMTRVWHEPFDYGAGECSVVANPPNDFMLSISKTLPDTEVNGSILTEAGIFTAGTDPGNPMTSPGSFLYARQVHSPIIKTATMTILYDWQLGITIQG